MPSKTEAVKQDAVAKPTIIERIRDKNPTIDAALFQEYMRSRLKQRYSQSLSANARSEQIIDFLVEIEIDDDWEANEDEFLAQTDGVAPSDKDQPEPLPEHVILIKQKDVPENKIDRAVESGGINALHKAAMNGELNVVQDLIKAGANPNLTENSGLNALDLARQMGYLDVIAFLEPLTNASKR